MRPMAGIVVRGCTVPRVGWKKSDRRWKAPDGQIWASKFEWAVYDSLKSAGVNVRKCDASDSITYHQPKPNVRCMDCASGNCSQERTYTPDLYIIPEGESKAIRAGYYVEVKGYFRSEKRTLFRCLRNDRTDISIRCILEADHWVTKGKTRLTDYFKRYLKTTPVHVWNGDIPEDWK